jgi:hypothetical protein
LLRALQWRVVQVALDATSTSGTPTIANMCYNYKRN